MPTSVPAAPDLSWITYQVVRSALKAWHNPQTLAAHPLGQLAPAAEPTADPSEPPSLRARALRDLLAATIAELRPDSGPPQPRQPRWRAFLILSELYTQGRSTDELLDMLAISYPHYKREHVRALERLAALLCERARPGAAAAAATSALYHLRAPTADFVGRQAEIAQLLAALAPAAEQGRVAAIVGLRGLGGIGKTELAYAAAQQLAEQFPDAQLLLELHGASPRPLSPAQALQAAIRAFSREQELPDDLGQLQALYRSLLTGKRVLIVADDARDAAQVRPLLPPSGSALLITSRQRFALPGLVALDLESLPSEAAEHLLLSICPRLGEAAGVLARYCGYLPLALRVSASLLSSDATRSVERYLRALEDERKRLKQLRDPEDAALDVEAALELSYRGLDAAAQAALCQLSVFPTSFDRAAAAAVLEAPEAAEDEAEEAGQQAEALLGRLYRRCLLEWDAVSARYRLHDLVRAFAAARLEPATREQVQRRHATYYQRVLAEAEARFVAAGEAGPEGLDVVDREWENLLAGQAWAAAHAESDATAALCSAYPDSGAYVLELRLHSQELIAWEQAGLSAARRMHDRAAEVRHLNRLGWAYLLLSELEGSTAHYQEALLLARAIGDQRGESSALRGLGWNYHMSGEQQAALACSEQALELARTMGDRRGEGLALQGVGTAYLGLGEPQRSRELYEQALALFRASGLRRCEQQALKDLGLVYHDLGDLRRAVQHYEQLFALCEATGSRLDHARTLVNLGEAYIDLGEGRHALGYLEEALVLYRAMGDRGGEGTVLGCLGEVYQQLGDIRQAMSYYEQALRIAREVGSRHGESYTLATLGSAQAACGALGAAEECYMQALTIARAIDNRVLEAVISWRFGGFLAQQGELERAAALMQAAVDWERAVGHLKATEHAAELAQLRQRLADDAAPP